MFELKDLGVKVAKILSKLKSQQPKRQLYITTYYSKGEFSS